MSGLTGRYSAFAGSKRLASGSLAEAALAAKDVIDHDDRVAVFVFEDASGRIVDLDMRGAASFLFSSRARTSSLLPRMSRSTIRPLASSKTKTATRSS
jgi:hypothetical protein